MTNNVAIIFLKTLGVIQEQSYNTKNIIKSNQIPLSAWVQIL